MMIFIGSMALDMLTSSYFKSSHESSPAEVEAGVHHHGHDHSHHSHHHHSNDEQVHQHYGMYEN
jgi:hypothetical protein